jgi:NADH-quinone oxidoreductase subunit J
MTPEAVIFYIFAALTVGSAATVVFARSLIYSAFSLLFTFFGVGGLYLLLGADFLAATQLLIYVGGILVLLLFGVMLTHKLYDLDLRSEVGPQFGAGLAAAVGLFALLAWPFGGPFDIPEWAQDSLGLAAKIDLRGLVFRTTWPVDAGRALEPTTAEIGRLFMGRFLLPFEAASILLLVALMGAAMIVRRRKDA